ncbi:MAG: hypothetical protein KC420_04945 [Myxococcales bacterium]|nr:hypothetical protein [Myxococcales bacterium]
MLARPLPLLSLLLPLLTPALACETPTDVDDGQGRLDAFREGWSASDDPSLLSPDFEYTFAALPTQGSAAKIPWAGSYWPTYRDSINDRWAGPGTMSAAKKYELAFAKSGVEDAVSAYSGIDSLAGKECTSDAQCDPNQGSVCAKRAGANAGVCSETWFGICHAWAPAAILEEEPAKAVTYKGIEFKVNDLKALMSLSYSEDLEVKFLSLRCDDKGDAPGTADKAACKDTNPGSFHVVIANLLGIQRRSLVEDRTYDYEVWNQPVRGFRVTQNQAISAKDANALLGGGALVSSQSKSGSVAEGAWNQLASVAISEGQGLKVSMSGSGDGDLYVRWNSQPTASAYACRPYLDGSDELCELAAPAGATSAKIAVQGYTAASVSVAIEVRAAASDVYAFNPDAASLRRIRTELEWIAESSQSVDGNLGGVIDTYTKKDVYEYILELDGAGEIIGGEWLGSSKQNHPDFLWLPVKKNPGTVAGAIAYSDVKALFDLANGGGGAPPPAALLDVSGSVGAGEWKHFAPISVDGGAEAVLTVKSGDADLYVRKGSQPTLSSYTCRPYLGGTDTESCALVGPGTFYVSVNGYDPASTFALKVAAK